MVLLISYDLNGHERPSAYAAVKQAIESGAGAGNFKKILYSQWLVDTTDSCDTWSDRIQKVADSNDRWLVMKVTPNYQGWLSKEIWDWLRARL
jgi:hypothetical protein